MTVSGLTSAAGRLTPEAARALFPILQRAGTVVESEIRGPSMGSTLPDGTRIHIRCGPVTTCRAGEVVAFLGVQGLVAHRVISLRRAHDAPGYLLTRGDALTLCDPPIPSHAALGVVTEWRRGDPDSWVPVPGPPPRRPVAAVVDGLAVGLLRIHPALAHWIVVRLLMIRGVFVRIRRRLGPGSAPAARAPVSP